MLATKRRLRRRGAKAKPGRAHRIDHTTATQPPILRRARLQRRRTQIAKASRKGNRR